MSGIGSATAVSGPVVSFFCCQFQMCTLPSYLERLCPPFFLLSGTHDQGLQQVAMQAPLMLQLALLQNSRKCVATLWLAAFRSWSYFVMKSLKMESNWSGVQLFPLILRCTVSSGHTLKWVEFWASPLQTTVVGSYFGVLPHAKKRERDFSRSL